MKADLPNEHLLLVLLAIIYTCTMIIALQCLLTVAKAGMFVENDLLETLYDSYIIRPKHVSRRYFFVFTLQMFLCSKGDCELDLI